MPQMGWEETRSIMSEVQELFAGSEVRCSFPALLLWLVMMMKRTA